MRTSFHLRLQERPNSRLYHCSHPREHSPLIRDVREIIRNKTSQIPTFRASHARSYIRIDSRRANHRPRASRAPSTLDPNDTCPLESCLFPCQCHPLDAVSRASRSFSRAQPRVLHHARSPSPSRSSSPSPARSRRTALRSMKMPERVEPTITGFNRGFSSRGGSRD